MPRMEITKITAPTQIRAMAVLLIKGPRLTSLPPIAGGMQHRNSNKMRHKEII